MDTVLMIDTSEINTVKVTVTLGGKTYVKISQSRVVKSQMVLPLIESLLKDHKIPLRAITQIRVATGPGSYTGLRVGASVANTLGFILDIPVNGKKALAIPIY